MGKARTEGEGFGLEGGGKVKVGRGSLGFGLKRYLVSKKI